MASRAEVIAHRLGGHRAGSGWIAPCPAHDDRKPSLSISEASNDRALVHCHAGCSSNAVIDALKAMGLWCYAPRPRARLRRDTAREPGNSAQEIERTRRALELWDCSRKARGTLVESYLASRGLALPPGARLRFNPRLRHSADGRVWSAMVALVTRGSDDEPIGIHRTFLARDGSAKAPVEPNKMMLGPTRGGYVRLGRFEPSLPLVVGEGIETCLSVQQETGYPAWAALSTSGMRALDLPPEVQDIIIIPDGDDAGEAAAQYSAVRWQREGRRCRIAARPPRGLDFNDLLLGRQGGP